MKVHRSGAVAATPTLGSHGAPAGCCRPHEHCGVIGQIFPPGYRWAVLPPAILVVGDLADAEAT